MVKLLRLCVDYGEDKILQIRSQLPENVVPTIDMVRYHLHEESESNIIHLQTREISITQTDLRKYDEKCGVAM